MGELAGLPVRATDDFARSGNRVVLWQRWGARVNIVTPIVSTLASSQVRRYLPSKFDVTAEVVAVLVGTLATAYIISRFPQLQKFVWDNSVQVRPAESGGPFLES
jgi:general stress protein CsbA